MIYDEQGPRYSTEIKCDRFCDAAKAQQQRDAIAFSILAPAAFVAVMVIGLAMAWRACG